MTIYDSIILGIVEGVTEFLPVSSTAHLVLTAQILGVRQDAFAMAYEIVIQMAPIVSVLFIFKKQIFHSKALWYRLIAAFIPTGAIGFLFHDTIEEMFTSNSTVMWMFLTGVAFLLVEWFYKEKEHHVGELVNISYPQAIAIGFFQAFALIPGVSRSGTTILGGLALGLKRSTSMSFSFLLAIPTMSVASGYVLLKDYQTFDFAHWELLAVGFFVSFAVGWIAVKGFLAIVSRYSFVPFGLYLLLSALLFWIFNI